MQQEPVTRKRILKLRSSRPPYTFLFALAVIVWTAVMAIGLIGATKGGSLAPADIPWNIVSGLVLVETLLTGCLIWCVMARCNPQFLIELDTPPGLGQVFTGRWRTTAGITKVTNATLMLEGREEALVKRNTRNSYRHTHVFARMPLVGPRTTEVKGGDLWVSMPEGYPASFLAGPHRIYWCIIGVGEVKNWPDTVDEFELEMGAPPRELKGTIEWNSEESNVERPVSLELAFYASAPNHVHRERVDLMQEVVVQPSQKFIQYSFRIPAGCPYTYSGVDLNVYWAIEVFDGSRLLGGWVPVLERRVIVSPTEEAMHFSVQKNLGDLLDNLKKLELEQQK